MRYMLIGNYGVDNIGDEAIKQYFLEAYPSIEWFVLSAKPAKGEYARLPFGLRSLLTNWVKTLWAYYNVDGVVFGGGSLFTDIESPKAICLWWWHTIPARVFGKPIYFAFQGVGPFLHPVSERKTRSILAKSAYLSVRDEASKKRVESMNLSTKIVQTFDPVILLDKAKKTNKSTKKVLVVIPRFNTNTKFEQRAIELSKNHEWDTVRIVSMQNAVEDRDVCLPLYSKLGSSVEFVTPSTYQDLLEALSDTSFVLSQRYHGALAALALEIEYDVESLQPGDKIEQIGLCQNKKGECITLAHEGQESLRTALLDA